MSDRQLTLRGCLLGIAGLFIITSSSMYVALRMGALPWPTVFVTVLSMSVLSRFKTHTLQEINVTHTLMSAGAMVAGGLAFTIPGIWMINPDIEVKFFPLLLMTVCGAVLGTQFSALYSTNLIEEQKLPYPIGQAAYQTLVTGVKNGKQSLKLFASMAFSAVFTGIRDVFGWIPSIVTVFGGSATVQPVTIWVSPMALAIGALIGKLSSMLWLGGAVLGYLIIEPLGIRFGLFENLAASSSFRENLGIGLMVGTGIGVLIKALIDAIKKRNDGPKKNKLSKYAITRGLVITVLASIVLGIGTELSLVQALIAVVGVALTTLLAGMFTGKSGVNPMEIFGILVMLLIQVCCKPSLMALFMAAGVVAVSCGLSGDVMNDFKSGHMLGTDFNQQVSAEAIGGVIGAVISVAVLFIMKKSFGMFGTDALPAPQAKAVASMAKSMEGGISFGTSPAFFVGILLGAVLYLLNVPASTIGLGIYLPMYISLIMGLGAIVTMIVRKVFPKVSDNDVSLVSSGLLGGEGISGVIIAIVSMMG